jgi:hypothetical protein
MAGTVLAAQPLPEFSTGISDRVVQFVDTQIAQAWEDNEVQPSPIADDAEWVRRVYLDIVGHIPPAAKLEAFLRDKSEDKRAKLIDDLLADPAYVRNFTEIWTNVLIGRDTPRRTSRAGMRRFLRESFAKNRPWNDIVYDLLTAEGHYEESGAANFILAQLDGNPNTEEYHVQATAKVAKIFLGLQVQCTQCHNHPFNEWKQNQFWELNSFMRQVRRVDHRKFNPETGRNEDDYSELVYRDFSGPVYYEMRNGLVQVAYPTYMGTEIDHDAVDRREELAKIMCRQDPEHQLARAVVNRMWAHYLGYGFTRPLDDLGPHNPASHPEVLERLTEEFVNRGYDLKQLSRWICNTRAYNQASRFNPKNTFDNPAAGEVPLFSHMYVKTMTAEQLFESLLVAAGGQSGNISDENRERWQQDFLGIFGTGDDEEPTSFSGSIPQALLMMNGPVVQAAVGDGKNAGSSYVAAVLSDPRLRNDMARMEALFLATLGRAPERIEVSQLQKSMRAAKNPLSAYQDLYWALLNSNEFMFNH